MPAYIVDRNGVVRWLNRAALLAVRRPARQADQPDRRPRVRRARAAGVRREAARHGRDDRGDRDRADRGRPQERRSTSARRSCSRTARSSACSGSPTRRRRRRPRAERRLTSHRGSSTFCAGSPTVSRRSRSRTRSASRGRRSATTSAACSAAWASTAGSRRCCARTSSSWCSRRWHACTTPWSSEPAAPGRARRCCSHARGSTSCSSTGRGFPSEIPHGHFIHRHGPQRLAGWGLLDRVLATGCPPATSLTTHFGDFPLVGTDLVVDGVPVGLGPRRAALDDVLVEAAVEAGVELREGFAVEDLVRDGDRVAGVRSTKGRHRAGALGDRRRRPELGRREARAGSGVRGRTDGVLLVLLVLERRDRRRARALSARPARHLRLPDERRALRDLRRVADRAAAAVRADTEGSCWPRSTAFPSSPSASARARARSASSARPSCRTSSVSRTGRAGRSSATRAATRIRSSRSASAMPSATPSCGRGPRGRAVGRAAGGRGAGRLRAAAERVDAARLPAEPRRGPARAAAAGVPRAPGSAARRRRGDEALLPRARGPVGASGRGLTGKPRPAAHRAHRTVGGRSRPT